MAVTQTIKLDLNNHKADAIILRVGESYTRKIVFIPGTYDGDDFKPTEFYGREEGPRALFRLVKPDRTFVMKNLTVVHEEPDTGVYSFELVPDEYMSQVAGIGYYDIRINDSDTEDEFLYTVQGRVLIDDDMITDSMIESVAAVNGYIFPDDYATKQYVDEAIAGMPVPPDIYSTDEHVVGTWIDGSIVYEKTIAISGVVSGVYTISMSGIKDFISYSGYIKDNWTPASLLPIPRVASDGNNIGIGNIYSNYFNLIIPPAFGNRLYDPIIIIRYTKNT